MLKPEIAKRIAIYFYACPNSRSDTWPVVWIGFLIVSYSSVHRMLHAETVAPFRRQENRISKFKKNFLRNFSAVSLSRAFFGSFLVGIVAKRVVSNRFWIF